jgi:hypothetical protein
MKGKFITVIGIVLIFGYFIMESFKNPSSVDPSQVVMVGKDTLGRDWGAIADQKAKEKEDMLKMQEGGTSTASGSSEGEMVPTGSLLGKEDPYQNDKFNSSGYTTIQAADGREIITGYNPTQQEEENTYQNYETRHQKELPRRANEEPVMNMNP